MEVLLKEELIAFAACPAQSCIIAEMVKALVALCEVLEFCLVAKKAATGALPLPRAGLPQARVLGDGGFEIDPWFRFFVGDILERVLLEVLHVNLLHQGDWPVEVVPDGGHGTSFLVFGKKK